MLRNPLKGVGCAIAVVAASSASAVDLGFSLGYGGIYTDNPTQVPVPPQNEWIHNANFGFELEQEGAGLEAGIDSAFSFSSFVNDTRDDVLRGDLDGAAIWHARPGSLEWHVQNVFGSVAIDELQSQNPINEQNTNAFSTGPRFMFKLGERNTIQVDLRWEDYYFEESLIDSQRLGGLVSWVRPLSATFISSVGLGGSTVEFDDPFTADDFERTDLFWKGEYESTASNLTMEYGYTDIRSDGPVDSSGPTALIDWSRQLGGESTLSIEVSSGFTDTGAALLERAFERPDVGGVQVNANPFRRTHAEITYGRDAAAGALDLSAFATDIEFDTGGNDREVVGAVAAYRRPMTARATLTMALRYGMTEFVDLVREDDDLRAALAFDYLVTPSLTLTVGGSWSDRQSTDPDSDFEELRGEIGITYSRGLGGE